MALSKFAREGSSRRQSIGFGSRIRRRSSTRALCKRQRRAAAMGAVGKLSLSPPARRTCSSAFTDWLGTDEYTGRLLTGPTPPPLHSDAANSRPLNGAAGPALRPNEKKKVAVHSKQINIPSDSGNKKKRNKKNEASK